MTESPTTPGQALPHPVPAPGLEARLAGVAVALGAEPDLRAAASALLHPLVEWTGAARGSLLVLNPASGRLAIVAAVGLRDGLLGQESPPRPRSISEWVFRNRRGLLLDGEVRDERFEGSAATDGIESALSLPLVTGGVPIGVLNLARLAPAPVFSAGDLAALEPCIVPVAEALARVGRMRAALLDLDRLAAHSGGSGSALMPPGASEMRHYDLGLAHRPAAVPAGDLCERVPHAGGVQSLVVLDRYQTQEAAAFLGKERGVGPACSGD